MASQDNVDDGHLHNEEPRRVLNDVDSDGGKGVGDIVNSAHGGMQLRQNRTLTEKGRLEQLRLLRNKTVSALTACSKSGRELDILTQNIDNLHLVKFGLDNFNGLFLDYRSCVDLYCSKLDEEERTLMRAGSDKNLTSLSSFRDLVASWVQCAEKELTDELSESVSQRGSEKSKKSTHSKSSRSFSKAGSVKLSLTHEKAKLAELLAEKSMLHTRAEVEMKLKEVDLNIQIAKVTAKEKVYAEADGGDKCRGDSTISRLGKLKPGKKENSLLQISSDNDNISYDPRVTSHAEMENIVGPTLYNSTPNHVNLQSNAGQQSQPLQNPQFSQQTLDPSAKNFYPVNQSYTQEPGTNVVDNQSSLYNNAVLETQRQMSQAMLLPKPEVPKFSGDPMEFSAFIMAFDARIVPHTSSESDRLYYLIQQLQGEPKDLVSACLHMDLLVGYATARDLLHKEYGDPYRISSAYLNKIRAWPNLKNEDNVGLRQFSIHLTKCLHAMNGISHMDVLNHAPNMISVVLKLPAYLQTRWRNNVTKMRMDGREEAKFKHLVEFIDFAARSANEPIYGKQALISKSHDTSCKDRIWDRNKHSLKSRFTSFATDVGSSLQRKSKGTTCFLCNSESHDLDDCKMFLRKSLSERRDYLRENNRCYSCYGLYHSSKGCMKKRICKKCGKRHPTALHDANFQSKQVQQDLGSKKESSTDQTNAKQVVTGATFCDNQRSKIEETVLQPILPVNVRQKGGDRIVQVYAMLDNGSTGCFIAEGLKDELQAKSSPTSLRLQTMNGTDLVNTTVVSDLIISDISDSHFVNLPRTFCKDIMPVGHDHIPKSDSLMQLPGLKDVAEMMPPYQPDLQIGLLIGSNCADALRPLEVIPSSGSGPFAVRYKLGWTINGPLQVIRDGEDQSVVCNLLTLKEHEKVSECISPDSVLKLFELDFSEADIGKVPGEQGYSIEDQRFTKETAENLRFVDGHFEIPLPFRNDSIMPSNREQAVKRVLWQRKKMMGNEQYLNDYVAFMDTLLAKGYAVEVPADEIACQPGHVWYLPHHGVYHPKKTNKIRVVFDCSAKYGGLSINDVLLQGPDLANSLIGVLTRFRSDQVAFIGDVEAMFHQVKVPQEHQDYLRFLWWPDGNIHGELKEYRMTAHCFGTVSSPTVANYALRSTAVKSRSIFDEQVAQTIERNFYVDDCLKSVESDECAAALIKNLRLACADGGFNLTKFTSNSKAVLSSIPQEHRSKQIQAVDLSRDDIPMERALGMQWDIALDSFKYTVELPEKSITRRGILSMVSSLYDPLGLVSPVLLPAKRILQDLCKDKDLGWDDNVGNEFVSRWTSWLREVEMLKGLTVRRCIKPPDFGDVSSRQLHVFSDASSTGYGCAAYIRLFDINGNIHTTLLLGKARLAPLKTLTIPRLELTAATVSVKLGQFLLRELDMIIDSITFYTDSTTVLQYIRNERNRFPVFVANRVKLIRDFSAPEQWKYVDSKTNPADIASRGSSCSRFLKCGEWFNGPQFLRTADTESTFEPQESVEALVTSTPNELAESPEDVVSKLLNYFSSWLKLKRAVAIYRRFFTFLKCNSQRAKSSLHGHLSLQELKDSEKSILHFVQKKEYGSEFAILSKCTEKENQTPELPKSSSIRNLRPWILDGLLRVGGRLSNANVSDTMKYPVILPRKSHISTLIVREIHESLGHVGRNHVLSALREEFWITNANSAVRSILNKCVPCRRFKMPTGQQMMSNLPANRVQPSPPFTYTGLDFFGPHPVKEGRKEVKRYGVLFTCMVSRAVHIETANSLDTDSFINALRRFISRRGAVTEISCDNGTNFTSGAKELRQAVKEIDQSRVHDYLLKSNIVWKFNPPSASHMGGVWERLIRSVRSVLNPLLKEFSYRLDDELFRTLLCEVESILNSRPLTTVCSDPTDVEVLTPNHLLMVRSSAYIPPPGVFQASDVYARRRWRRVQYLAELFWNRWRREYLLTLQKRQKWQAPKRNFKVNDIVLIKDDNLPRNAWLIARVVDTEPDSHGIVRSVTLKTRGSYLRRPIHKLVLLVPAVD